MSQSTPEPHAQSGSRPERGDKSRRPPRRKLTAAQRRKNRLRLLYIVVAVAMVLFLLAGVFAPTSVPG
jgi:hypothetical protein